MSPDYPSNYGDHVDCSWKLTSPIGTKITLTFDEFATDSSNDILKLYDGPSPNGGYFPYKGIGPYADFQSTGNSLYLKFESDQSISSSGFKILYSWPGNKNEQLFSGFGIEAIAIVYNNQQYFCMFLELQG